MSATIILRDNPTSGSVPTPSAIHQAELVLNTADGRLFTKNASGQIILLNARPTVNGVDYQYISNIPVGLVSSSTQLPAAVINVSGTTLYSTNPAAGGGFNQTDTIVFGGGAGVASTYAFESIFIGPFAGENATSGSLSVFIGSGAGSGGANASSSVMIGCIAGEDAINAHNAVFIGRNSGKTATNAEHSVFIGLDAGSFATNAAFSVLIGDSAGVGSTNSVDNVFIGSFAGWGADTAASSVFIGEAAGYNATDALESTFIGQSAGELSAFANNAVFIGQTAGQSAIHASESVFIGTTAGLGGAYSHRTTAIGAAAGTGQYSASYSTFVGYGTAGTTAGLHQLGRNNIVIGNSVTLPDARQDSINIGNIIFGSGTHFPTNPGAELPSYTPSGQGKVGINVVTPRYTLDVSGSGNYTHGLTISGSAQLTQYTEHVEYPTISGNAVTLDLSLANTFDILVNANITTMTISNPAPSGVAQSFTIIARYDGSYSITWPTAVKWPGGVAPTISTTSGSTDIFTATTNNAGGKYYGIFVGKGY